MSKLLSLLINEMIIISKMVQENKILNNFFAEVKNDKRNLHNRN